MAIEKRASNAAGVIASDKIWGWGGYDYAHVDILVPQRFCLLGGELDNVIFGTKDELLCAGDLGLVGRRRGSRR